MRLFLILTLGSFLLNAGERGNPSCGPSLSEILKYQKTLGLHLKLTKIEVELEKLEEELINYQSGRSRRGGRLNLDTDKGLTSVMQARDVAMMRFTGSEVLIPKNGVAHIIGPEFNFYEWALPAIYREDITIHVSDPHFSLLRATYVKEGVANPVKNYLKDVYDALLGQKPYLGQKQYSNIMSDFETFYASLKDRVHFHYKAEQVEVQADFVLSRLPQTELGNLNSRQSAKMDLLNRIDSSLKPGGVAWVIPEPAFINRRSFEERGYPSQNVFEVRSDLAGYMPEPLLYDQVRRQSGEATSVIFPVAEEGYIPGYPEGIEGGVFVVKPAPQESDDVTLPF